MESLTHDKIAQILKNVDQDENNSIEFVEFLTHSLTRKHLSDQNIELFFNMMLPFNYEPVKKEKHKILKMYSESSVKLTNLMTSSHSKKVEEDVEEAADNEEKKEPTLTAKDIHKYFQKCGKTIKRKQLKKLMTQCGKHLELDGFNGSAQIDLEMFKRFLTKMLDEQ